MADIKTELGTIRDNFEELITMFGGDPENNQEYKELKNNIDKLPNNITHYLGNINDTLIEQNPDAKQIITLLIPKSNDGGETRIEGVLHKNK